MPDANVGSITQFINDSVVPLPAGVSGVLTNLVNNQRFFIEQFTGDSIGEVIAEKYQSALTDLSLAETAKMMALQDLGVKSVKVGGLTTDNSNLMMVSQQLHDKAMKELKSLSKGIKSFKARG